MLSKRKLKLFKSLQIKKYRQQEGLFLVEGAKGVEETLKSDLKVDHLLLTEDFANQLEFDRSAIDEIQIVSEKELVAAGTFSSNNAGLAVVRIPENRSEINSSGLIIALDRVQDPGNLGTIIRICDWYGITQIICSNDTADLYNPKVINATMGSFTRVNLQYVDLAKALKNALLPKYGALLGGQSIYDAELVGNAIIVMGNESQGISAEIEELIDHPIEIPRVGGAESLNVGVATAIVLDNFVR